MRTIQSLLSVAAVISAASAFSLMPLNSRADNKPASTNPPHTITIRQTVDLGTQHGTSVRGCIPPTGEELPTGYCFTISLTSLSPGPFSIVEDFETFYSNTYFEFITTFTGQYSPSTTVAVKYQILGVDYAPPGAQSYVNYTTNNTRGTSTSNSSTYANTVSVSVSNLHDTIDGTGSYTQESDSTSSITVEGSTTSGIIVRGPANSSVGVDHDYDIIWVWLNPIIELDVNSATSLQWAGYTYNPNDPVNEMDVVGIPVVELKSPSLMPEGLVEALARSWDTASPPGQAALTAADYATILDADPFEVNASFNPNTDSTGRFTLQSGESFQYLPPPPGGQPTTETYSLNSQSTSSAGQGAKYSYSVGISSEGSFFDLISLKTADTYTATDSWSSTVTNTTGQIASLSITGPSASDNYTGPINIQVWRDNIYGSFMFYAVP